MGNTGIGTVRRPRRAGAETLRCVVAALAKGDSHYRWSAPSREVFQALAEMYILNQRFLKVASFKCPV
tara:strand:+ start:723 stop:926 length:204 start_codon:yes stop_codon:yes gene_type:complete